MKTIKRSIICMLVLFCIQLHAQSISYELPYSQEELINRTLNVELAVGKTNGKHHVSPTGAFQYEVPIEIPVGTKAMEPKIAINYSSQAGNGLLGYGWGISGLSVISRVNRDHFHEGHSANVLQTSSDPMAWDGNRLVLVQGQQNIDGAIYKTEAETFTKITLKGQFGNGADWLELETKEGLLLEFGRTSNSKVLSLDGKVVMAWKINKSIDRYGNFIQYEYQTLNGEHLIKRISYTGNDQLEQAPYAHINFYYAEREDQNILFASEYGQQVIKNNLLTEIDITYGEANESFKRYTFTYSNPFYSYLNEIKEYGKLRSESHFNAIRFSYAVAAHAFAAHSTGINQGATDLYPGDFNGDGLDDVLRAYKSVQNGVKYYHAYDLLLNSSQGFGTPISLALPSGKILEPQPNTAIIRDRGLLHFGIGDFNGDAKMDILIAQAYDTPNNMHLSSLELWQSQIIGNQVQFGYGAYPVPNHAKLGLQNALLVGDYNGDGAHDIYLNLHDGHKADFGVHEDNQYYPVIYCPRMSPNPMPVNGVPQIESHSLSKRDLMYTLDLNGDSKSDLMQIYGHSNDNTTKVKSFHYYAPGYFNVEYLYVDDRAGAAYANFPNRGQALRFGDFNGDGKTDLLCSSNNDKVNWSLYLSTGKQFAWTNNLNIFARNFGEHLQIADLNGDGLSDIFLSTHVSGNITTHLDISYSKGAVVNQGVQFEQAGELYANVITGSQAAWFLDYDGDGAKEFISSPSVFDPMEIGHFSRNNGFGQLNGISTGYNELSMISYASIADHKDDCRGLYAEGSQEEYPLIEFQKPMYVVSEIQIPNGSGVQGNGLNQVLFRYYYQGAKLHRQGKGLLGFEQVSFDQVNLDGLDKQIVFHADEYEFDRQFYFSRLKKSHVSIAAYDNHEPNNGQSGPACLDARAIVKNLHSKELSFQTIGLPANRFINQLDYSKEGNNLVGFTVETEFKYTSPFASEQGNPNQIIRTRAFGSPEQEQQIIDLKYGQFGTPIPNAVIERSTTVTRGNQPPFETMHRYAYNASTGSETSMKKYNPNNSVLVLEKRTSYHPQFGLPTEITMHVPNHQKSNRVSQLEYDILGRFLIKKTNPLGYEESWEYDDLSGRKITYNDPLPNNDIKQYAYDDFHRLNSEQDEFGITSSIRRGFDITQSNSTEEPEVTLFWLEEESPGFASVKGWYDANGRLRKQETDGQNQKTYQVWDYNAKGKLKRQSDPFFTGQFGQSKTFEYDDFERLAKENTIDKNGTLLFSNLYASQTHTGIASPYQYINRNIVNSYTRADGYHTSSTIDASGRIIQRLDPSAQIDYVYSSEGKVLSTEVNGVVLNQMSYDALGNQIGLTEINSGQTNYQYNAIGELTGLIDSKGNSSHSFIYDELGRLLEKQVTDLSGGTEQYEFVYGQTGNSIGQLIEAQVVGGVLYRYQYNENGQIHSVEENMAGKQYIMDYEYDNLGRIETEKNRTTDTKTIYEYSSISILEQVKSDYNGQEEIIFSGQNQDQFGNWIDAVNLGGLPCHKAFDDFGLPVSFSFPGVYEERYGFNPMNGNLEFRENVLTSKRETFTYDGVERLKQVDLNGQTNQRMNYNASGNITFKSDQGNYKYHPSKTHALSQIDNSLVSIQTSLQNIEYNPAQDPSFIQEGDIEIQYTYGPFQERKVAKRINHQTGDETYRHYTTAGEFEYDRNYREQIQVEYLIGVDGLAAMRVQLDNDPERTNLYGVQHDYLGSLNSFTNEMGQVVYQQSFDAWGRDRNPLTWEASANFLPQTPNWLWRGYTGHEHLRDFQLIHMNGRLQDPYTARMLSPDNFVSNLANSQSYNRYAYVNNNPLKYTDPDGELPLAAVIFAGAAGAYLGGTVANEGNYNPMEWNFQSGKTWGYMVAGAVVAGASVHLATAVATSGIPLANTAAIVTASAVNSTGTHLYTGGKTDLIVGFGAASYNFMSNEWGYLGKKGNSKMENWAYGIGTFANLSDIYGLAHGAFGNKAGELDLITKNDPIGHSELNHANGDPIVSVGPDYITDPMGNIYNAEGTNNWPSYANERGLVSKIRINNVRLDKVNAYAQNNLQNFRYKALSQNCVTSASNALLKGGVLNLPILRHPTLLQFQIFIRKNTHFTPFLYDL